MFSEKNMPYARNGIKRIDLHLVVLAPVRGTAFTRSTFSLA
jgi:hypothetical protein